MSEKRKKKGRRRRKRRKSVWKSQKNFKKKVKITLSELKINT